MFYGVLLGVLAGIVSGGRVKSLLARRIRGEGTLMMTLAAQVIMPAFVQRFGGGSEELLYVLWVLLMMTTCMVALMNWRVWGMTMVSVGIALNLLVIALNGAMPVSMDAVTRIDPSATAAILSADPFHEPMSESTLLPWLGDILGVPGPVWHRGVVSLGDVLLVVGLGLYCYRGTLQGDPE